MKYLLISACVLGLVPAAQAGDVNITFSEKFAESLQDKLGEREGPYLIKQLTRDIEQEFGDDLVTMGDINIKIKNDEDVRLGRKRFIFTMDLIRIDTACPLVGHG